MSDVQESLLEHLGTAHSHKGSSANGNIAKLLLWSNFVATAVEMLRDAGRNLNDPTLGASFKERIGWYRDKPQPDGKGNSVKIPDEDAVTDALVALMRTSLLTPRPGVDLAQLHHVCVFSQQKRTRQQAIGAKGRLNTDLTIYLADQTVLDLKIEAKVIVVTGEVTSAYCSKEGLLRFADPVSPYTVEWVGGMVAYCFITSQAGWEEKVKEAVATIPDVLRANCVTAAEHDASTLLVTDIRNCSALESVSVFHVGLEFPTGPIHNDWKPAQRPRKSPCGPQKKTPVKRPLSKKKKVK